MAHCCCRARRRKRGFLSEGTRLHRRGFAKPQAARLDNEGDKMPINPNDVTWVEAPKIGLIEQMYLPAILQGMGTTVRHSINTMFGIGPKVTQQFPEERPKLPGNYRGVHRLNRDEQGRVRCVACYMCSTACPAHCIHIVGEEAPWSDREKYPAKFDIDELRCIYCGMCEEACPVDAIELTYEYDIVGLTRSELICE